MPMRNLRSPRFDRLGSIGVGIENEFASVIDHSMSTLVFIIFLVEFLTVKGAGNSTFLILGLMSLFDVIAGFTVTIVAARRDFAVGEGGVHLD